MAATKIQPNTQPNNPFIKQLASSNRTTRDRALASLRTYLSRPTAFTALDLLKLWKGLFYCMFMSDKPRNQQALARELASLTDVLGSPAAKLAFLDAFWKTLAREWENIDYLRLDKYLYLVRCMVNCGFCILADRQWDEEVVAAYAKGLEEEGGPLSARDAKVPNGLRLHVLDVWVDELEKVDRDKGLAPLEKIMEPVRRLGRGSLVKSVRERAKESVGDERLVDGRAWKVEEDVRQQEGGGGDDEDFGGFED